MLRTTVLRAVQANSNSGRPQRLTLLTTNVLVPNVSEGLPRLRESLFRQKTPRSNVPSFECVPQESSDGTAACGDVDRWTNDET